MATFSKVDCWMLWLQLLKVDEQVLLSALVPFFKGLCTEWFYAQALFYDAFDGPSVFLYGRAPFPCSSTASLCLNLEYPIDEVSILKGHKTHNYFENMWLRKAAQAAGFTDYLRVNRAGYVCETSTANCFFIREEKRYGVYRFRNHSGRHSWMSYRNHGLWNGRHQRRWASRSRRLL